MPLTGFIDSSSTPKIDDMGIPFSTSPSMASWRSDPYVFLVLYILDFLCVFVMTKFETSYVCLVLFRSLLLERLLRMLIMLLEKVLFFSPFSVKLVSISCFLYWVYGVAFDYVGTISIRKFENIVSISCFKLKLWSMLAYGFWMLKFSIWECL